MGSSSERIAFLDSLRAIAIIMVVGVHAIGYCMELPQGPKQIVSFIESYSLVAKTWGGLGASGLTSLMVEKLPLNILTLNGVKPVPEMLASKAYPLAKDIILSSLPVLLRLP
jgi:hypothetical protein